MRLGAASAPFDHQHLDQNFLCHVLDLGHAASSLAKPGIEEIDPSVRLTTIMIHMGVSFGVTRS
jgi:hypothetical protein